MQTHREPSIERVTRATSPYMTQAAEHRSPARHHEVMSGSQWPTQHVTMTDGMNLSPSNASTGAYIRGHSQAPIYVEEQRTQSMTFNETGMAVKSAAAQRIKEDMLDVINDLKAKQAWQLSEEQAADADAIVKRMIFSKSDDVGHVYELVRSLFELLRSWTRDSLSQQQLPQPPQIESRGREEDQETTRRISKNIEIVLDVFKRAAEKVGKVGEREWRQVFDQQRYVLEEVLKSGKSKQSAGLDEALADFNFLLKKAVENLV
jgi:hypothetical protein